MTTKYKNLVAMLATHDWALMPCYMELLKEVADLRSSGKEWTPDEIAQRIAEQRAKFPLADDRELIYGDLNHGNLKHGGDRIYREDYDSKPQKPYLMREGIAIVPLEGVLLPKASYFQQISGAGSMEVFSRRMHFAGDDGDAKSILIDCGSPGGSALGVSEAQRAVIDAKAKKPVHVYVRDMMCSGAYWIGCPADEIHIPESSVGGSIGVYQMHCDRSAQDKMLGEHWSYVSAGPRKVDGNPHEPLKGDARQAVQRRVDHIYGNFLATVAQHRNLKSDDLIKATGGGDFFYGKLCLEMGLCDTNLHFEQVIDRMKSLSGTKTSVSFASAKSTGDAPVAHTSENTAVSRESARDEGTVTRVEKAESARREEGQVDKDLKLCLYSLGIVKSQEASDEAARAALEAWATGAGVTLPEGDDKIKSFFVDRVRAGLAGNFAGNSANHTSAQAGSGNGNRGSGEMDAAAVRKQEKKRQDEIRARAALMAESGTRVTAEEIKEAIDSDWSVKDAVDVWTSKARPTALEGRRLNVEVTLDAGDALSGPVAQALCLKLGGIEKGQEISQEARYMSSRGMNYIAEKVCEVTGGRFLSVEDQAKHFLRVTGGTKDKPIRVCNPLTYDEQQAGMVSGVQPAYTPGTLPAAFAAPMRQRIMRSMQTVPATYQQIGKRWEDASDFDGEELVFWSAKGKLPLREDGRPRKQGEQMAVRPAWWKVQEFGDEARLTWQTVISGKLQQFNSLIQDKTWGHEQTVNEYAVLGVTGNPAMFDGYNMFQTADQSSGGKVVRRANAIAGGSGGSVTVPQMMLVDAAMAIQPDFDLKNPMALDPVKLWLPTSQRIPGRQFKYWSNGPQNETASAPSSVSLWKTVEALHEPMLDSVNANTWYAFADPERCPVVVYQFLQGHGPGGVWEMYYDPDTSSQVYAIRGVFAVAIVRWHGVVRNPGS
jgi:signal peptide peptidase SppA